MNSRLILPAIGAFMGLIGFRSVTADQSDFVDQEPVCVKEGIDAERIGPEPDSFPKPAQRGTPRQTRTDYYPDCQGYEVKITWIWLGTSDGDGKWIVKSFESRLRHLGPKGVD